MVVSCEEVWREVSNYLDDEVTPDLRTAIEEHVRGCKGCTAVVEGTRNVIQLYGDPRMLEMPVGFSRRLHTKLEDGMGASRRTFVGWLVAAAAGILLAGTFEISRLSSFGGPRLRSEHARAYDRIPPDMTVVAAEDGKIFHVAGCTFIHDKDRLRTLTAREAERLGYTPCIRCMKKYLDASALLNRKDDEEGRAAGQSNLRT